MQIRAYEGKSLSRFRTLNRAENFCEVSGAQDALEAFKYAQDKKLTPFVLGAGSNVFFKNSDIKSFVIKNTLPESIEDLGGGRIRVSSSVGMMAFLQYALKNSLDAPYYLASAPCQIGGAIAMNAGTGPKEGLAIFDFVESVEFVEGGKVISKDKSEIKISHRHTEFLDRPNVFILSAVFTLPEKIYDADPIRARLAWAAENQDLKSNNCGSLCNRYDARLMKFARLMFSKLPAGMSAKKLNWTINNSDNPFWLRAFLKTLTLLHKIFRKELKFEIRMVE